MMQSEFLCPDEIVLSNGKIVDGCGNPWSLGALAILVNFAKLKVV